MKLFFFSRFALWRAKENIIFCERCACSKYTVPFAHETNEANINLKNDVQRGTSIVHLYFFHLNYIIKLNCRLKKNCTRARTTKKWKKNSKWMHENVSHFTLVWKYVAVDFDKIKWNDYDVIHAHMSLLLVTSWRPSYPAVLSSLMSFDGK